ncbi:bifunctional NAD(P)H-hydrate repair enzyme Nnr [bacterium BMS3Bbin05]|nr:bifunctional NAD(P)H-hydrate repair enzyme Nnr [bacterium BMS3Bbin05]HDL20011.1 NAD(P)H-hydrate dehydratase [Nitrospirota bacterium]
MKVVTADQMRSIDGRTIKDFGVSSSVLMERAGEAVAERITDIFEKKPVVIISGGGNNGGDGIVAGRILSNRGWDVRGLLLIKEDRLSPDCLSQYRIAKDMRLNIEFRDKITATDIRHSIIVDALLGTGLNKPVQGSLLSAIIAINGSDSPVISVDMPSGISSDSGQILGQAVNADYTVTFGLPKIGHFLHPGADCTGKLFVEDIGFPSFLTGSDDLNRNIADLDTVQRILKVRDKNTHKGNYGHVFVIAGSEGKTGAAILASRACMRSGVGAVTMGVADNIFGTIQSRALEEMTIRLPSSSEDHLNEVASKKALDFINSRADAVLLGPGLGVNDDVVKFVRQILLKSEKPLLADADGLNCIARMPGILRDAKAGVILTPHPGEMKRLMAEEYPDITPEDINGNRVEIAERFASGNGVVCVLKGAPAVVASPGGEVYINTTGNPGMATAGSGDVLSGIISGLMAQKYGMLYSAVCGVYIHGLAGDLAADELGEYSLVAGDIIRYLPKAFGRVMACRIVS